MPMYACDIPRVYPGTELAQVIEAASLTPEEAGEWATDALESASFLRELVSLEDLTQLLAEAGERSLNLSNLVRGEISTLMKVKEEISYNRWDKEWTVTLPSGTLVFAQCEDCVEIQTAALAEVSGDIEDEDYICAHCGAETETLDSDGLCPSCARTQEAFDDGECPRCGTPSPGSRECYNC
jgi:hypothetical protein